MSALSVGAAFAELGVKGFPQFEQTLAQARGRVEQTGKAGDTLGAKFGDAFKRAGAAASNFVAQVRQVGERAQVAFAAGTAAITGFVAAASPEALKTFTGSLQLLAAEVGRSFVPFALEASKKIQDLTRWYRGLDDATKDNVARWVLWGTAGAGALVVAGKLVTAFTALAPVIQGVGAALAGLGGPLTAALAGMGLLAAAAYKFQSQRAEASARASAAARPAEEQFTREQFERGPHFRRFAAISDPQERARAVRETGEAAAAELQEANKDAAYYRTKTGTFFNAGPFGYSPKAEAAFARERAAAQNAAMITAAGRETLGLGKFESKAGGKGGEGFLAALGGRPGQYLDLGAVREQANLAAMGGDPIQRRIQQIQEETRDAVQRAAAGIDVLVRRPGPVS